MITQLRNEVFAYHDSSVAKESELETTKKELSRLQSAHEALTRAHTVLMEEMLEITQRAESERKSALSSQQRLATEAAELQIELSSLREEYNQLKQVHAKDVNCHAELLIAKQVMMNERKRDYFPSFF